MMAASKRYAAEQVVMNLLSADANLWVTGEAHAIFTTWRE